MFYFARRSTYYIWFSETHGKVYQKRELNSYAVHMAKLIDGKLGKWRDTQAAPI
jgi:hypothetical protein